MSEELTISVSGIAGSRLCVASDDGQKVHDPIAAALRENRRVTVSFLNVISLTSAFLSSAVGQRYGEFSGDHLRSHLRVSDISPSDAALLERVADTAKDYFEDPERLIRARSEALEEQDDE